MGTIYRVFVFPFGSVNLVGFMLTFIEVCVCVALIQNGHDLEFGEKSWVQVNIVYPRIGFLDTEYSQILLTKCFSYF